MFHGKAGSNPISEKLPQFPVFGMKSTMFVEKSSIVHRPTTTKNKTNLSTKVLCTTNMVEALLISPLLVDFPA